MSADDAPETAATLKKYMRLDSYVGLMEIDVRAAMHSCYFTKLECVHRETGNKAALADLPNPRNGYGVTSNNIYRIFLK